MTKKILSVFLAVVLVLGTVAVSVAADSCEHQFSDTTKPVCDLCGTEFYRSYDLSYTDSTIVFKMDVPEKVSYEPFSGQRDCTRFDVFMIANNSGEYAAYEDDYNSGCCFGLYDINSSNVNAGGYCTKEGNTFTVTLIPAGIERVRDFSAENPYIWLHIRPCDSGSAKDWGWDSMRSFYDSTVCLGQFASLDDFRNVNPVGAHEHAFAADWTTDTTAHWHECTAEDCTITDYAACGVAEAAYGTHEWEDSKCTVCGFVCDHNGLEEGTCEICGTKLVIPEVLNITELTTSAVGEAVELEVLVSKPVKRIVFVDGNGNTTTFGTSSTNTVSVVNNDDGTQTWTVNLTVRHANDKYTVMVKEKSSGEWSEREYAFNLSHIHKFATKWTTNETAHWYECTAAECDIEDYATCGVEEVAYSEHNWENGVCKDCGYVCDHKGIEEGKCEYCDVTLVIPEVLNITENTAPAIGENVELEVLVSTSVKKIMFTDKDGYTFNYAASSENTISVVNNDDGTQTWTVELPVTHANNTYTVNAKISSADEWGERVYTYERTHAHAYSSKWTSNETAHWHVCTAAECTIEDYATCDLEGVAYSEHNWENGVCEDCGYVCDHKGITEGECEICDVTLVIPEVLNVTELADPIIGEDVELEVLISKPVKKVLFVDDGGNTTTYSTTSAKTVSIVDNDDGTQTWTVKLAVAHANNSYTVTVKESSRDDWSEREYTFDRSHAHVFSSRWVTDEAAHWHKCLDSKCTIEDYATCGLEGVAYGAHEWEDGKCAVCEFVCDHKGLTEGECEICGTVLVKEADPEIISVTELTAPVVGEDIKLEVVTSKPVRKVQFADVKGNTYTYTAGSAKTESVVTNDDNTQTWTLNLTVRHSVDEYNVKVKETSTSDWAENTYAYKVEVAAPVVADEIISVEFPDAEDGKIKYGTHTIVITTGKDVSRVQVAYAGTTTTFSKSSTKATVEEVDDTLVWTITLNFYKVGSIDYAFASRASSGDWKTSEFTETLETYRATKTAVAEEVDL